uniref:Uncharacterized protein n=1 Tax=Oryza meridionalis TaxID=40149 RepID=A0A0E0F622_9ORYZ
MARRHLLFAGADLFAAADPPTPCSRRRIWPPPGAQQQVHTPRCSRWWIRPRGRSSVSRGNGGGDGGKVDDGEDEKNGRRRRKKRLRWGLTK